MSEIKLLPCPFCGGEAKLCDAGIEPSCYWIYCRECGCKQPSSIHRKSVIKAWNERKPIQQIVERLEEELNDSKNSTDINDEYYTGMWHGVEIAYDLVKKVGGMNEHTKRF